MKSCPFCGSDNVKQTDKIHYGHGDSTCEVFVGCVDCKAQGPDTGFWGTPTAEQRRKSIVLWDERK